MKPIELKEATFADQIAKGVTLVDFWAAWCGPCKMQGPILDALAADLGDAVTIGKVNVDDEVALAGQFNIRSIPTLAIFKDGQLADISVGLQSKEALRAKIDAILQ